MCVCVFFKQYKLSSDPSAKQRFLTILLSVVSPVRTLIGIVSRNAELQRRNAGQVFIV